ncbi:MAG TPA: hypothetical protein VLW05_08685 [Gaiellaceae bacterium]|nr:hypothetical protein [Gaiellaceae bacterium]
MELPLVAEPPAPPVALLVIDGSFPPGEVSPTVASPLWALPVEAGPAPTPPDDPPAPPSPGVAGVWSAAGAPVPAFPPAPPAPLPAPFDASPEVLSPFAATPPDPFPPDVFWPLRSTASPAVDFALPVSPLSDAASPPVLPPPDLALAPPAIVAAFPDELPPVLPLEPPDDAFVAFPAEFPPVFPPLADVLPLAVEEFPPVFPPSPPAETQPACWQVSAEPPRALPPTAAFELPALPPDPEAAPPVADPPLAVALPLVAVAWLWSTVATCAPVTLTWTMIGIGWTGEPFCASAAGTTTKAADAASAPSSHRVLVDTI